MSQPYNAHYLLTDRNYSAVMPECFYRASKFPLAAALAAALDSR